MRDPTNHTTIVFDGFELRYYPVLSRLVACVGAEELAETHLSGQAVDSLLAWADDVARTYVTDREEEDSAV